MKRIRKLTEERGWDYRDLAYHARIAESTAKSLMSGKQGRFDGDVMVKTARALGTTVADLFVGYEQDLPGNQEPQGGRWFDGPATLGRNGDGLSTSRHLAALYHCL
jgi:transcriptional regulator with XRE-family HTH domain